MREIWMGLFALACCAMASGTMRMRRKTINQPPSAGAC